MRFEYDPNKSAANLDRHGIDFEYAQALWDDATVEFTANVKGEGRTKAIGRIGGEYWAAIYTMRGEALRIISVRAATPEERSAYDRYANN